MKIGWWDCGNLDNEYCGKDGGSNLRIPLLKQLNGHGHTIFAEMVDPGNYDYDEAGLHRIESEAGISFVDECKRFRESMDFVIETDLEDVMPELDSVIVEARRLDFDEYERQIEVMKLALNWNIPVFVLDRNNWAQHISDSLQESCYLLRPYYQEHPDWPESLQVYFPYFYRRDVPDIDLDPEFDLVYIGNRYGREEQMDQFLDGLDELSILVCGNWPDRDQIVTENHDFTFVGSTPHFATIPTLQLGRASFHVGKPDYNEIGFLTLRPYEAKTARRPCFINSDIEYINELVDNHRWATNESDWVKSMLDKDFSHLKQEAGSNFTRTTTDARVQLEELIRHGP